MKQQRVVLVGAAFLLAASCGPWSSGGSSVRPSTPTVAPSSPAVAGIPTILVAPIPMPTFAQVAAPSGSVVWVLVGGLELFRSKDRGDTWQQRPQPSSPGTEWISFVDDYEGWVISSGSPATQCQVQLVWIWHTVDEGANWLRLNATGIGDTRCKSSLSFVDPTHGFLVAWDPNHMPVIYRSSDGGRTWSASQPLPDPPGFTSQAGGVTLMPGQVHAFGPTLLVQAGRYIFRSTDGGATWSYLVSTPDGSSSIAFVTATRWLDLVPGQSKETLDAGTTWHGYASDYHQAAGVAPQLAFGDAQVGYATVRGGLKRTVDGGLHWVVLRTPGTSP